MAVKFIEFLRTSKHFCLIRSDIEFRLICNPYGDDLLKGTDICTLPAGAFVFDLWKLLPEEYFKNNPVFKLGLAYDDTLLVNGKKVSVDYSDVDYGSGIAGLVGSTESSLASIVTQLTALALAVSTIDGKIGAIDTPNSILKFLSQIKMYSESMHDVLGYFETHSIIDDTGVIKDVLEEIDSLVSLLQSQIESDLYSVRNDVSTVKTDVATVKTDVATVKTDTAAIKIDVGTLESNSNAMLSFLLNIKDDVSQISASVQAIDRHCLVIEKRMDKALERITLHFWSVVCNVFSAVMDDVAQGISFYGVLDLNNVLHTTFKNVVLYSNLVSYFMDRVLGYIDIPAKEITLKGLSGTDVIELVFDYGAGSFISCFVNGTAVTGVTLEFDIESSR